MRYLQENGAWYKTYHEPFFFLGWYEWLAWIVSLEWISDLGIVFLHLKPQIEPLKPKLYQPVFDFEIEMTPNDERKGDPM